MKTILVSTFLLICLAGCAQNNQTKMEEEKQVIELTDKVTEFMIERNLDALNKILDTHFTLTHITGYVQSKVEWLKEIETESMKYYSYEAVNRNVKIIENKAQVIQQNKLDARIWGSRNVWNLQQIFQLEKQNGNWIILSSVASIF